MTDFPNWPPLPPVSTPPSSASVEAFEAWDRSPVCPLPDPDKNIYGGKKWTDEKNGKRKENDSGLS